MNLSAAGKVLVSRTVKDLAAGARAAFRACRQSQTQGRGRWLGTVFRQPSIGVNFCWRCQA